MIEQSTDQSSSSGQKTKNTLSRRAFLGIDWAKRNFSGLKNIFEGVSPQNKDRLTEFLGEGAAIFAIWHVARVGARDPILTYSVKTEQAVGDLQQFAEMVRETDECRNIFQPCNVQSASLYNRWQDEFEKSRLVTKTRTYIDEDGEMQTETYTETEYYWDEPRDLTNFGLDHSKIGQWNKILKNLDIQFQRLDNKSPEAIDLSKGEGSLYYVAKEVDTKKELTKNSILYGAVGLTFAFYEEILSAINKYGAVQANKNVGRRTVLKLISAGAMAWGLRKVQLKFVTKNNGILDRMKNYNAQVIDQMDVDDFENFRNYFGIDLPLLRNTLAEINTVCSAACNVDYSGWSRQDRADWEKVMPEALKMAETAKKSVSKFDQKFPPNTSSPNAGLSIPPNLTALTKYVQATDKIIDFAKKEKSRVGLNHWLNALGLAAGLATVATIGEGYFVLTEK